MDKEVKKKWLKALTSGEYKKAKGTLYNHGRYCCLGVLCDIEEVPYVISPSGRRVYGTSDKDLSYFPNGENDISTTDLPKYVAKKVGISHDHKCNLVKLNDGRKDTGWNKVVEYIKKKL